MPGARDERGLSLVEVLIASVLTLVILGMAYGILNTTTKTANAVANRAHNSTQAALAVATLENNTRYANGIWVCAPITATPQNASTASISCPVYTTGTAALLVSNDTALASVASGPSCAEWIIPATGGLYEVQLGSLSTTTATFPITPVTNIPGVVPAVGGSGTTTGFSIPIPRLVVTDMTVNQDPVGSYVSGDGVTVHDVVAPDNLTTQDNTTNVPCN